LDLRAELQAHLGTAYTLGRELGGGGMSRVFLAEDVRLGRTVVIKVLSPELAQGLNVDRFEREIRLAASLQQANIVPLLVAGDVGGLPYFTMPFVEGESLRARLSRGALPINEVVPILRDITRALAYAHARGVVHRDIKPDNVLLSGDAAVVTDFGIAKAISASRTNSDDNATLTQLGTSLGTPAYMSPEQVAGDPNVDHRADLYALGCMAFELLTGQQPFGNRTPQRMLAAHLTETPPAITTLRPDCPPALAETIARLMAKNPDERAQSATELYPVLDASATTTSGAAVAFSAPGMFKKALLWYAAALVAVAILAKAAVVGIGLPDWVFPGAILVMALGLPALLATAYVQRVARHIATATPTLTPGGTNTVRAPVGTMANMALKASPHLTWRRAARGGYIALGVFVLMVAGFMTLRAMGIGPWGSLFAAGRLAINDKIVVADFESPAADSTLGPILSEAARAALGQSKSVRPIEPAAVADILQQMTRSRDTRLDAATAREVATRAGASAVLNGRIASAGTGYVVSMDLTSATNAAMLASVQGSADGPADLLSTVDKLTRKLRGQMGESLKEVQRAVPLELATTASLPALRKYTEAVHANDVEADYTTAILAAREAVALDSTFALAWRKLAVALASSHASRLAQDSALTQAMRFADKLPDREKYLVLGSYYGSTLHLDYSKAIEAYRRVLAADSTNNTAIFNLTGLFASQQQFDSAAAYSSRAYRLRPSQVNAGSWAIDLTTAGHADSAMRVLQRADSGASVPILVTAKYYAFLGLGQRDSALALAVKSSQSPVASLRTRANEWLAAMYQTTGQLSAANTVDSLLGDALASFSALGAFPLTDAENDIRYRGRPDRGVRVIDQTVSSAAWKSMPEQDRPFYWLIGLYAAAGRADRARALLNEFWQANSSLLSAPGVQGVVASMEGEIALAGANYPAALRFFRAAAVGPDGADCKACGEYNLGRVYDRMGQPDSALAHFNAYLAEPPARRINIDWAALAGIQKRLGELYDAKGDTTNAVKHYAAFTDLWKDADPDLQPVVTTVKKRMGELTSR
jgi:tetratricopeptide (TPR) repeat protein/tRNA A-37 threonylcarbamoyl transferase component Bud32